MLRARAPTGYARAAATWWALWARSLASEPGRAASASASGLRRLRVGIECSTATSSMTWRPPRPLGKFCVRAP